ncbi:ABC transporter permease subunit [Bacillus salacetis]|uniref:ABC transporter permease subunit n=1 Tax=Bacillus salacetis TaxID=2315464 RepID=A0A3A1QU55_9BACI|nr:ABC transporter permease subunit [Bacillus salacetis]RIW30415.1 ABC transporter permease subunit [Bacillus salacetis]
MNSGTKISNFDKRDRLITTLLTMSRIFAEIVMTILFIIFIIVFAKTYFLLFTPQWFSVFIYRLNELLIRLIHFEEIRIRISEYKNLGIMEVILEPYRYTAVLISCILFLSILTGVLLAFFVSLLPERWQSIVHKFIFFIESLPDVVLIFSIQLFIIWVYKKSAVLLVNPIGGPDDVYLLPILVTSILPSVILFQMTAMAMEEERNKAYVDFSYSKGLSKGAVLASHIFRNVCVTVFSKIQFILWFIISNLLIIENLFNMNGLFRFIYKNLHSSEVLAVCLLMIFLPLYFADYIGKWAANRLAGERSLL